MTRGHLMLRLRALAGAATAASLCLSCRLGPDLATLDARTLHLSSHAPAVSAGEGSTAMRATYFPSAAPRARRRDVPVLVVEPLLFRRELLFAGHRPEGGLVRYLQDEGFRVWLVGPEAPSPPGARALGRGIAEAVASIAKETGTRRFDLLGVSLGAEGALRALEVLTAPGAAVEIRRVAFLGGGFDFAYPRSFASRVAKIRGAAPDALCSLDGDTGCARDFRQPAVASPWLAPLPLPVADDDALAPARDRFPFVARLTRTPVLFVNGKADGIAPSESMFPLYTLWGSDEPDPGKVPKLLFLAGRENALGWDFDHFDLLAGDHAEDAWDHLVTWLRQNE